MSPINSYIYVQNDEANGFFNARDLKSFFFFVKKNPSLYQ